MTVEVFSLQTGWDFEQSAHRRKFLSRVRAEEPHEILMSPTCRLWSQLQELTVLCSVSRVRGELDC